MGKAIVATHCVPDASALRDQLSNLQFGDPFYYLLQRPDCITDWKDGHPDTAEIASYIYGRAFGKNGEVRWQKTVRGYALLWLSEGDLPEGFTQLGEWKTTAPQKVFLIGGGETKPWRDTRIPRKLKYPMEWCKSPSVKVIHYKELTSQTIRFTRYTEFAD